MTGLQPGWLKDELLMERVMSGGGTALERRKMMFVCLSEFHKRKNNCYPFFGTFSQVLQRWDVIPQPQSPLPGRYYYHNFLTDKTNATSRWQSQNLKSQAA